MLRITVTAALLTVVVVQASAGPPSERFQAMAQRLTAERERPSLFVRATAAPGLRTVDDLRQSIQSGHGEALWAALLEKVRVELEEPVITPMVVRDGERVLGNRAYGLVGATAHRIADAALVGLVTGEQRFVDGALAQIRALFDDTMWPEWADQAHLNKGMHADLRHGQLVFPVALAYDWLYHLLTPDQRQEIIAGIQRCAVAPYQAGFAAGEHWSRRRSNWMTVVLGGFGMAGMAFGPDLPESALLVANALPQMEAYLEVLGPDGAFNESVQYAGSMNNVVRFFTAMRYASGGEDNPFARHGLRDFYHWYMQMTFPPGRVAGFGDPAADMPPVVVPAAAVAAALRDPQIQWFYEQYCDKMLASHRYRAIELLNYDASLVSASPDGVLPLGRAYHHQGMLVSSRSSWDPQSAVSVVYGKAGREDYHSHADWGQVCLDGYGDRLVVDLGSPPGYPDGGYEYYYNYQQFGHNVFVFGHNDTGGVSYREKKRDGVITDARFDKHGGTWTMDLSSVYGEGYTVTRKVMHFLPRVVAVWDEATLPAVQPISLRWHLADTVEPRDDGTFLVRTEHAVLVGRLVRVDGEAQLRTGQHAYAPPYNKHRLGEVFDQRHEPYLELTTEDDHCKVVTVFAVLPAGSEPEVSHGDEGAWQLEIPEGRLSLHPEEGIVRIENTHGTVCPTFDPRQE